MGSYREIWTSKEVKIANIYKKIHSLLYINTIFEIYELKYDSLIVGNYMVGSDVLRQM